MNKKEKKWIKAAGIRAVKTMAQTAAATIGTTVLLSEVDWRMVISASVLSGILSLLTSVAGLPEVGKG
ncbi:MAG: holin [Lachnospiraceae bacterium]|nr:holin [Lachnospiraceae bacterium]